MSGLVVAGNDLRPFGLATDDATEATEAVEVLLGRTRCDGPAIEGDRGFTFIGALAATLVVEAAERVLWRGGTCNSDAADSKLVAAEETGREAIEARGVVSPALDAAAPRASDGFGLAVLVLVAVVREEAEEEAVEDGVGGGAPPFRRVVGVAAFERIEGAVDLGLTGVSGAFVALVPATRRGVPILGTGEAGGAGDADVEGSSVSLVSDRRRVVLRFSCEGVVEPPTGEGIGELGFLLGEADPLARRGVAGTSRLGAGRRGVEVDAAVAALLVESAFDFERFRFSTLARIEVMLATSISGSSRSLDISAANPARVLGPRITSGGEMRSLSFSISRSGTAINGRQCPRKAIQTHPELFLGGPIVRDHQSHLPVEPAPSSCATNAEFPLVCLPRVVAQQSRWAKMRPWDR